LLRNSNKKGGKGPNWALEPYDDDDDDDSFSHFKMVAFKIVR
jgi:hypothetical protein